MVDIYDRLTASLTVLQNYRPVQGLFSSSKEKDVGFIHSLAAGQAMTLKRFEQLLQRYQVTAITCVGATLDPYTMKAVATGHEPKLANGIVLEELRTGFLFQNTVLRLAEVKVNKINIR